MTWDLVQFAVKSAGRTGPSVVRMSVGKQAGKLAVLTVVPPAIAAELGWKVGTMVAVARGQGDHDGWVRFVPNAVAHGRALRPTGKSNNLRYVTPLWPWLAATVTETHTLEVVDHRIAVSVGGGGARCLDVRVPSWARITDPADGAPADKTASPAAASPPKPAPFRIGARSSAPAPRGARSMSLGAAGYPQPSV